MIALLVAPLKVRLKLPPVGVPVKVRVCTALVALMSRGWLLSWLKAVVSWTRPPLMAKGPAMAATAAVLANTRVPALTVVTPA